MYLLAVNMTGGSEKKGWEREGGGRIVCGKKRSTPDEMLIGCYLNVLLKSLLDSSWRVLTREFLGVAQHLISGMHRQLFIVCLFDNG